MMRPLVAALAVGIAGMSPALLQLQFANRWNQHEDLMSHYTGAIASTDGTLIAVGQSGPDIILSKYDGSGNLLDRRIYDQPGGGREQLCEAISDGASGVVVAYGGRNASVRFARFNENLAPLIDGEVWGSGFTYKTMTVTGSRVIFAADGAQDAYLADRNFSGGNNFTATINFGPKDQISKLAVHNNELLVVGGDGDSAILIWRNAVTGAAVRDHPVVPPSYLSSNLARFNDVTVDANDGDIIAVGQGLLGSNLAPIVYSVELNGSGPATVTNVGDWIPRRIARASGASVVAFAVGANVANTSFSVKSISTETGVIVNHGSSLDFDGGALSLFVPAAAGYVMSSGARAAQNIMGNVYPPGLNAYETVPSTNPGPAVELSSFCAGPFANTAFAVGSADYPDSHRVHAKVALIGANRISDHEENLFGFPQRQPLASAEDAAGARYIANAAVDVNGSYLRSNLIKVTSAGAVAWSRNLPWVDRDLDASVGYAVAIANDGGVLVAGTSGTIYTTSVRGYITKFSASDGTAVWTRSIKFNGAGIEFNHLRVAGDGSIYALGKSYYSGLSGDLYAAKFTPNGELIWQKNFDLAGGLEETIYGAEIVPTGIAVAFRNQNTARLRVLSSSAGGILWDRVLPDPNGASAGVMRLATGPANTLTVAVHYSDGSNRKVIGVYRLDPIAKTTILNTRIAADVETFEVVTLSNGAPIILDGKNRKLTSIHPTNGSVAWKRTLIATISQGVKLKVDRLNNLYALMSERQQPLVENTLLSIFSSGGVGIENRRSGGTPIDMGVGLDDSVWVVGSIATLNRGEEVSFLRYTQTLP